LSVLLALQAPVSPRSPQAGRIDVWPQVPRQGQTLFFRCAPSSGARSASAIWAGRTIPVQIEDGVIRGAIGMRITEPLGVQTLVVRYKDPADRSAQLAAQVTVGRTSFPVRHLTMKRSTEKLYNFPGAKAEDAQVSSAVRTKSADWLWEGAFRLPTRGRYSTPFGVKRIRNRRTSYYHRGLDLAAPEGTPVYAPNGGRVVLARKFRKYGNTIVLDHGGGITTLYLHLSRLDAAEGDVLTRGQRLGDVGMTGVATGPHLHWSLYVHGLSVNPLSWVRMPDAFALANASRIASSGTAPARKIRGGETVRSTSVDGVPPGVGPASRIASMASPRPARTSSPVRGGGAPDGLALGAAMGRPKARARARATG
jgi:hypothetical protein